MKLVCGCTTENSPRVTKIDNGHLQTSIQNRVCGDVEKDFLIGAWGCFAPFSPQYPSPNRKESAPSINTQATAHGCHHNKLEVRPKLRETKFQVSVAKRKRGTPPHRAVYSVGPTQEFLVVSTFSFNVLGVLLVLTLKVTTGFKSFPLKKTSRFALQRQTYRGAVPRKASPPSQITNSRLQNKSLKNRKASRTTRPLRFFSRRAFPVPKGTNTPELQRQAVG